MPKFIKRVLILICLIAVLILPYFVFAGTNSSTLQELETVGTKSGPYEVAQEFTLAQTIGTVVAAALSLIGVIFIVLMVYGGYNWMIARGEEQKVDLAKDTIKRAVIGLIITVGAYAIWALINTYLLGATVAG